MSYKGFVFVLPMIKVAEFRLFTRALCVITIILILVGCSARADAVHDFSEKIRIKFIAKFGFLILLAIGGIIVVVFRKMFSIIDTVSQQSTIAKIKKDPRQALDFAASLDMPYKTIKFISADDFKRLQAAMMTEAMVDIYDIVYACPVDQNRFLIFTTLNTLSYEINALGRASDTNKTVQHNFVLQYDPTEYTLTVYSDIYTNNDDKFQKQAFLKA